MISRVLRAPEWSLESGRHYRIIRDAKRLPQAVSVPLRLRRWTGVLGNPRHYIVEAEGPPKNRL